MSWNDGRITRTSSIKAPEVAEEFQSVTTFTRFKQRFSILFSDDDLESRNSQFSEPATASSAQDSEKTQKTPKTNNLRKSKSKTWKRVSKILPMLIGNDSDSDEQAEPSDEDMEFWANHQMEAADPSVQNERGGSSSQECRHEAKENYQDGQRKMLRAMRQFKVHRTWKQSFLVANKSEPVSFGNFVIKHDSRMRICWDFFVLSLILLSSVVVPFHYAFYHNKCEREFCKTYFLSYISLLVDFIFFLDICLNFRTSFKDEDGKRVTVHSKIAVEYMSKGYFFVDVVSTIPFASILIAIDPADQHVYYPLYLLKLGRVVRAVHIYTRVVEKLQLSGYIDIMTAIGMYSVLFCFGHWTSCGFWIVVNIEDPTTAFQGYLEDSRLAHSDHIAEKYIVSWYWSIVTLTTIGYGDISPSSTEERLFCGLVCVFSVSVFSYLIAMASRLVADQNVRSAHFKAESKLLMQYSVRNKLPHDLQRRMHLFHRYRHAHNRDNKDANIVSKFSKGMQLEIALVCHERHLKKVPSFKNASKDFFERMCSVVSTEFFAPNEIIYREGDYGDSMYVMTKGMALLHFRAGGQTYIIHQGRPFGDIAVLGLASSKRPGTVTTITHCETSRIMKEDLSRILEYYPRIKMQIRVDGLWNLLRKAFGLARFFVKEQSSRGGHTFVNYSDLSSRTTTPLSRATSSNSTPRSTFSARSRFGTIEEENEEDPHMSMQRISERVFSNFTGEEDTSVGRVPSRIPVSRSSTKSNTLPLGLEQLEKQLRIQQETMMHFQEQTAQKLDSFRDSFRSRLKLLKECDTKICRESEGNTVLNKEEFIEAVRDAVVKDLKVGVLDELKDMIAHELKSVFPTVSEQQKS